MCCVYWGVVSSRYWEVPVQFCTGDAAATWVQYGIYTIVPGYRLIHPRGRYNDWCARYPFFSFPSDMYSTRRYRTMYVRLLHPYHVYAGLVQYLSSPGCSERSPALAEPETCRQITSSGWKWNSQRFMDVSMFQIGMASGPRPMHRSTIYIQYVGTEYLPPYLVSLCPLPHHNSVGTCFGVM